MEGAEPLIARDFRLTVVALKITMVKLVEEVADVHPSIALFASGYRVVARMRADCEQDLSLQLKKKVDRVGSYQDVD